MPTARELLDQADALMRRNRLARAPAAEDGIPTLTDAIAARAAESLASAEQHTPAPRIQSAANPIDDVPLLTDAVEEIEAPSILEEPPDVDDPAMWTDTLTGAHTIIPAVPLEVPREGDHAQGVGVLPEEWGEAAPHPGPALAVETIDIAAMPDPAPERPVGPDAAAPPPPLESFTVDF